MDDTFNIMGIDPGSRTLGISIFTLNGKLEIQEIKTFNVNIDFELDVGIHDTIVDRNRKLKYIITTMYYLFNPVMVSMESSFINGARLGAVIPLTKSIHVVEATLYSLDRYSKVVTIPPGVIKKVFGARQVGKDAVLEAFNKKPELVNKVKDLDMTEHEIDAIAITYTLLEYLKTNKGMVCLRYLSI